MIDLIVSNDGIFYSLASQHETRINFWDCLQQCDFESKVQLCKLSGGFPDMQTAYVKS